jgi:pyridoxal phosphate enzyme (YggS family)
MTRAEELAANLTRVRERVDAAQQSAGRQVQLIVVTKFFPASDVRILADLGVTDVGENRHQEAQAKHAECVDLGLRWHFIGGLQSNKAGAVAGYADAVHSVDRARLVAPLDGGAARAGRRVGVLVQVSLDGPDAGEGRSGAPEADIERLAEAITASEHLDLLGLMAVAPLDGPLGGDPDAAFAALAEIRSRFLARFASATMLSAGMSADLEAAIAHGATHVRVGSAVLGSRPRLQ